MICQIAAGGASLRQIADELNTRGIGVAVHRRIVLGRGPARDVAPGCRTLCHGPARSGRWSAPCRVLGSPARSRGITPPVKMTGVQFNGTAGMAKTLGHLKRAIEDALVMRGSRDFEDLAAIAGSSTRSWGGSSCRCRSVRKNCSISWRRDGRCSKTVASPPMTCRVKRSPKSLHCSVSIAACRPMTASPYQS